jgi:MFS family permease
MNLVFSPFSDAYGRKKFHIFGLAIFTGASIACGFSQDIYQLIGFRLLQAFGAAAPAIVGKIELCLKKRKRKRNTLLFTLLCFLPIGSGAVSDMFEIGERAQALGLFLLGPLIGPGKDKDKDKDKDNDKNKNKQNKQSQNSPPPPLFLVSVSDGSHLWRSFGFS